MLKSKRMNDKIIQNIEKISNELDALNPPLSPVQIIDNSVKT